MKCYSCGVEKDLNVDVIYPYSEDDLITEKPVPQLFTIECEPKGQGDYRMCVMCHECWHRLAAADGIDLWINEEAWESLNPLVPFPALPKPRSGVERDSNEFWGAENYPL